MFMKSSIKSLVVAFAITSLLFYCCKKSVKELSNPQIAVSQTSSNAEAPAGVTFCGFGQDAPLTAGQTIPAGGIVIGNDSANLYITYNTAGTDWKLKELHLSVDGNNGGDCTQSKSSDLAPGKFPYSKIFSTANTTSSNISQLPSSYTFVIPRSSLANYTCFCIYPHAVVVRISGTSAETQTAWGGTVQRIINGKWYGGTSYCLQICAPPAPVSQMRTVTQEEWAAQPDGSNMGTYLDDHFASNFPAGLMIGMPKGKHVTLTNSNAVRNFLPQTGDPIYIDNIYTDPAGSYSSVWGDLVAAELTAAFDYSDPDFASSEYNFKNARFMNGVFADKTVQEVIDIANQVLGTTDMSLATLDDVANALRAANNNYKGGNTDGGNLKPSVGIIVKD